MRLKLLFLPWYHTDLTTGKPSSALGFPPLGTATLTSYLRQHSINVEQDDLDVKVANHNVTSNEEKKINLELFADEKKIEHLIKTSHEPKLESEGEKILKLTKLKGFDVIGFSLGTDENPSVIGIALVLAKLLKEKYDCTIIIGGLIGKLGRMTLLNSGFIDCEILSSRFTALGEINLLNFCLMYEKGIEIKKIPGTIYTENGKLVETRKPEEYRREEILFITRPDFDGLPLELYRQRISISIEGNECHSKIMILPYFFIRGCPNDCVYCIYSTQPLISLKDPAEVASDLKFLSTKYKTKYFFFLNTEINPTYRYADKITRELIENDVNILWSDCATFNNMDAKLLTKLKDAGAARLIWGLETGSKKLLKYLRKRFTLTHAKNMLRKSHQLGIWNQLDMICGFPYENERDIILTINFLKKTRKYINDINLTKFFIDGLFQREPEKHGIKLREEKELYRDWSTIPFDEIKGVKWEKKIKQTTSFYEMLQEAFRKFGIPHPQPLPYVFLLAEIKRELGIKTDKLSVWGL